MPGPSAPRFPFLRGILIGLLVGLVAGLAIAHRYDGTISRLFANETVDFLVGVPALWVFALVYLLSRLSGRASQEKNQAYDWCLARRGARTLTVLLIVGFVMSSVGAAGAVIISFTTALSGGSAENDWLIPFSLVVMFLGMGVTAGAWEARRAASRAVTDVHE